MTNGGHRRAWAQRLKENAESWQEVLREVDPFEAWGETCSPDARAHDELLSALEILFGDAQDPMAMRFVQRAVDVAERTIREKTLTSVRCSGGWPANQARLLRSKAYAKWLCGHGLNEQDLHQASVDYEAWALGFGGSTWRSEAQAYYLNAVRLSLIAGDLDNARRLLATRKSLKWHLREADLWKGLLSADALSLRHDDNLRSKLEAFFDDVRDPDYNPGVFFESFILPLEVGLIRDKASASFYGTIDWRRVIEAVSA